MSSDVKIALVKIAHDKIAKFNTAYYLAKNETPFNNFPELIKLQEKNEVRDIMKAYLTDKKCAEFTKYITNVITEELE